MLLFGTFVFLWTILYAYSQCEFSSTDGSYKVSWYLNQATKQVHFLINARQKSPNGFWTGIGFGPGGMQSGDFIIANVFSGEVAVTDRHAIGFAEPLVDAKQDIRVVKSSVHDETIEVEFSRPISTGDSEDATLQDPGNNNCQIFIFPTSGGVSTSIRNIRKHSGTPESKNICNLDACVPPPTGPQSGGVDVPLIPTRQSPISPPGPEVDISQPQQTIDQITGTGTRDRLDNLRKLTLPGRHRVPALAEETEITRPLVVAAVVPVTTKSLIPENEAICDRAFDHHACQKYVTEYLASVFKTFDRNEPNMRQACSLLLSTQVGLVRRECCNTLSQSSICRRFMTPTSG